MQPAVWPTSLAWILDGLETTTRQESHETKMESGHVRMRVLSRGRTVLKGTVRMNTKMWEALRALSNEPTGIFSWGDKRLTFVKPPLLKEQHLSTGNPGKNSATVEIELFVTHAE